jgi:hypothetical protein
MSFVLEHFHLHRFLHDLMSRLLPILWH